MDGTLILGENPPWGVSQVNVMNGEIPVLSARYPQLLPLIAGSLFPPEEYPDIGFGNTVIYSNTLGLAHSAITLGTSNGGDIYSFQKMNMAMPYAVLTVYDLSLVGSYGTPTIYTPP